jgi:hypothetical protein
MNAIPYDRPEEEWDRFEDEPEAALPGRPRRQVLTWGSAALFALLLGVIGFYVGVRVEKDQVSNSTAASSIAGAARTGSGTGAAARTGAAGRTGAPGAGATGRSGTASGAGGGAGFRGLFGGASGAGGSASLGTLSTIDGNTLYITETSGNTVKVTLSSATKVTKNVAVGKNAMRPGDLVVVQGAKDSNGTVSATSVNDTGASPAAAATGGGSGSSSSGSGASSAVNSLFGGG